MLEPSSWLVSVPVAPPGAPWSKLAGKPHRLTGPDRYGEFCVQGDGYAVALEHEANRLTVDLFHGGAVASYSGRAPAEAKTLVTLPLVESTGPMPASIAAQKAK